MKNSRKLFSLIAVAMVAMLAFAACGDKDSGDPSSPDSKTVEAKYRFSGGDWFVNGTGYITGAKSKLDKNSFSVQGGGASISYTGVYTEGGGTVIGKPWAYVYDADNIKIGFVMGETYTQLAIGKTYCNYSYSSLFSDGGQTLVTDDMQDDVNGEADSP